MTRHIPTSRPFPQEKYYHHTELINKPVRLPIPVTANLKHRTSVRAGCSYSCAAFVIVSVYELGSRSYLPGYRHLAVGYPQAVKEMSFQNQGHMNPRDGLRRRYTISKIVEITPFLPPTPPVQFRTRLRLPIVRSWQILSDSRARSLDRVCA